MEKICKIEGFIFVSASDGTVTIYGRKDNTYYHTLKLHSKTILDFDVHRSGRLMVSYGGEGKIKLSDLASMAEVYHKNIKSCSRGAHQISTSSASCPTTTCCSARATSS